MSIFRNDVCDEVNIMMIMIYHIYHSIVDSGVVYTCESVAQRIRCLTTIQEIPGLYLGLIEILCINEVHTQGETGQFTFANSFSTLFKMNDSGGIRIHPLSNWCQKPAP